METKDNSIKIAYVTFKFPDFSETFVQREVKQLQDSNISVDVYSIRDARDTNWNIKRNEGNEILTKYFPLTKIQTYRNTFDIFSKKSAYREEIVDYIKQTTNKSIPWHHILAYLPSISSIILDIDSNNYDHIHSHWAGLPTSVAKIASDITDTPYSISAHAHDIYTNSSINLQEKISSAEFLVTCTDYNRRHLQNNYSDCKIYKNYHGLVPEDYQCSRSGESTTRIVAGGRFVEKKGFDVLVNALRRLEKMNGVQVPCTIFGNGPMYDQIKRKKSRFEMEYLNLPGKIPHEEVKKILSNAQVFVAPSVIAGNGDRDGIPNVILEAFASCTPAIGTNISGLPEVVREGETGWLVPENDEEQLAESILYAWQQPELCFQYGRSGKELVESEFDVRDNVKELISIFEENIY